MPEGQRHGRRREHPGGWKGLRADWRSFRSRFRRHTSVDHRRFLVLVILLGTVLRILRMDSPATYDEALTYVNYAGHSFGSIFSDYTFTGNHILYSACARISVLLFGVHAWALRLPALLAGILAMPLAYAFARLVFNRHIAAIVLSLVAVSGPLVEYSAMARGYSLVWLFLLAGLLAARHYVKTENGWSLCFLALCAALGMWATPEMTYPALLVFFWAGAMLVASYESTIRRRMVKLAFAFLLAIGLCFLFYAPVIYTHSLDQLLHHPTNAGNTWARFINSQQDRAFDLWAYFTDTASGALAIAGSVAVIYSAYMSTKYRLLLFSMAAATVPVVLLQHVVAPPAVWTFSLFVLHLGSAIGIFYLLKTVRDKWAPGFSKARRTLYASLFLLVVFGWCGIRGKGDSLDRFPEAVPAAAWIKAHVQPGDRVCAAMPWDAPLAFQLACDQGDPRVFDGAPAPGHRVYVLVGAGHGQTPGGVALNAGLGARWPAAPRLVETWQRLELFADR